MASKDSFADLDDDLGGAPAPAATKGVRTRAAAATGRPRAEEPLTDSPIQVRPAESIAEDFRNYSIDGPEGGKRANWKRSHKDLWEDGFECLRKMEQALLDGGHVASRQEVPEKLDELAEKLAKPKKRK